jgi:hypothetical protein
MLSIIILNIYEIISERIINITKQKSSEPKRKIKKNLYNRWKSSIETVIINKRYKIRYFRTRIYIMIKEFRAQSYWFITAISIINSILVDIIILI